MKRLSVVIPFFQREVGVLGKALSSIENQIVPAGWEIQIIVVDDGSPVPARQEVDGFNFTGARKLLLIEQENAGPGAARNRALDASTPNSDAIAFLDSDDAWPNDHISRGVSALDDGYDFYFTDNFRLGLHESQVRLCAETSKFITLQPDSDDPIDIPSALMVGLCLTEFPCQASTIIFRSDVAADLRFQTHLKYAGEDILFFTELLARSKRIAFDQHSKVDCGAGVNIYFGNLSWDSPKILQVKTDQFIAHSTLSRSRFLQAENKVLNESRIAFFKRDLAFHWARGIIKNPDRTWCQIRRLWKQEPFGVLKILAHLPLVPIHRLRRRLTPTSI